MTLVAVVGDCTTTTCLSIAATWVEDVVILEADRSGGSLSAWLDTPGTPSLSTIVANAPVTLPTIVAMTQRGAGGINFIAAPIRARAAAMAIREATTTVFPELASPDHPAVLADAGRYHAGDSPPAVLALAELIVLCHRQEPASTGAETARLERLLEVVESLAPLSIPIVLVVIGRDPFEPAEIASFIRDSSPDALATVNLLPTDDLAAAVLAGRVGVSAKRLLRLPLTRAAADLSATIHAALIGRQAHSRMPESRRVEGLTLP
jgi:MinD-like ATPase involved in chromosome partitioning or flagellar assembly